MENRVDCESIDAKGTISSLIEGCVDGGSAFSLAGGGDTGGAGAAWEERWPSGGAACFAVQGRRPKMEDRFTLVEHLAKDTPLQLFAVYDGHGGEVGRPFSFSLLFFTPHSFSPSEFARLILGLQLEFVSLIQANLLVHKIELLYGRITKLLLARW